MSRIRYPLSDKLNRAIATLFPDPTQAHGLLGLDSVFPDDWYEKALPTTEDTIERARKLRSKLELYVCQSAEEAEEYQCPEQTERLRSEVTGLLLSLRELAYHIPEVVQNDKRQE